MVPFVILQATILYLPTPLTSTKKKKTSVIYGKVGFAHSAC